MSRDTKAMQDEDTANPGMLSVLDGEALWSAKAGEAGRACADCHGDAASSMKGVAARYPAFDEKRAAPVDLEGAHQHLPHRAAEGAGASRSRARSCSRLRPSWRGNRAGMPIENSDERLKPFIEAGRAMFNRRQGQLNLACAQCHDDNWGQKLAGIPMPAGASHRISVVPARMADGRLAAAAPAQLPDRHARRDLCVRVTRVRRARDLPDVARTRHADRDARGAAVARAPDRSSVILI